MNLTISSCFEFGYPSLSSMLMSFPDIFVLSPTKNICDRCTVKLNETFLLLKYNISDYLHVIKTTQPTPVAPCGEFTTNTYSKVPPPPGYHSRSFNNSGMSSSGYFEASSFEQYPNHHSQEPHRKLYERRNAPEVLMYGLNSLSNLASLFYEPPKPDTPPSNVKMPFWVDPVWRYQNSPPVECLNIQLPELSTVNLFPIVLSPFAIRDPSQNQSDSKQQNPSYSKNTSKSDN
ncbi:hypothetical protein DMENIID0001_097770 [Sergentomyia squamirostris]